VAAGSFDIAGAGGPPRTLGASTAGSPGPPASPVTAADGSGQRQNPVAAGSGIPAPGIVGTPHRVPPAMPSLRESRREQAQAAEGGDTPTRRLFEKITDEISKLYVGQEELVLGTLVALFSSGHVLIESVPGLGKTLFVRSLGRVLGCRFGRIQFTADLMPSDITGAPIFDMKTQEFRFRPGPVFTQFLLADEINRSPAKTHAALLEIMQEYRVTIDGVSHPLERPFLVLATQNPIESEGTYNLPEAQLDRFMFKLIADYPEEQEESSILKLHSTQADINDRLEHELQTVTSPREILETTKQNAQVRLDDRLFDYINKIVRITRQWPQFHLGASPRAGIALVQGARTLAAFSGRDYAVPDDVVQIVLPALRHRVILTAEAEVEGHNVDELLAEVVKSVEVPRS
jgi:MoxR-like ATPase